MSFWFPPVRSISNRISLGFCIPLPELGEGLEFGKPVRLNSRWAWEQREQIKVWETSLDQAAEKAYCGHSTARAFFALVRLLLYLIFITKCVCVCECVCLCRYLHDYRCCYSNEDEAGSAKAGVTDTFELPSKVLGTKLRSSAKAANTFNSQAIFAVPLLLFKDRFPHLSIQELALIF